MAKPDGPVELWLRQRNLEVAGTIVHEDETTTAVVVDALSIRGAQREMTGWMIEEGYRPVGRWVNEQHDEQDHWPIEVSRKFTPVKEVTPNEQR